MNRALAQGAAIAALVGAAPVLAQAAKEPAKDAAKDGLSLSGTTRLRYEAIDDQARAGFNRADDLVNLRTILLAEVRDGPVRVAAELWDSRVYAEDRGTPVTTGEVNTFELVQAFAEVRLPVAQGGTATLQAGRFLMNLGSRRLVAADDYRNTTNGYTGARIDLAKRAWKATLVYTLPQQRRPDDADSLRRNAVAFDHEGFDLVLWGGVVSHARTIGAALVEASFFHLAERDTPARPTRDRSLDTASLRILRDPAPGRFDGEVEAIAQRGHVSTSTVASAGRQAVRAWFLHADAGYTFRDAWKTHVALEYDHASGDSPGGANGRFDTLFGMRRADLAPAGLYNAFGRTNEISPGARVETVPGAHTDVMATLRPIWLASRFDAFSTTGVRDATGRSGDFAGVQFDTRLPHQPLPWLRLELDAVLLAKGHFLRTAPNAPPGRWTRYLSLNATASF